MTVEMELIGVRVQMPNNAPILLLGESGGQRRTVPIYIGGPEAHAIDLALSGTQTARPMTHDLITILLGGLGCSVEQVLVTELRQGTFFAELSIRDAGGDVQVFSARPSDAIAIAVRTGAPILAEEALVDEAGITEESEPEEVEEEAMVEELRKFLDQANPDDFRS